MGPMAMESSDACCDPCAEPAMPAHLLMSVDCSPGFGGGLLSGLVTKVTLAVCVASVVYVKVAAAVATAVPALVAAGLVAASLSVFAVTQLVAQALIRLDRLTVKVDRTTFEQWQAAQERLSRLPSGIEHQRLSSGVAGLLGPGEPPEQAVPRARHLQAVPSEP